MNKIYFIFLLAISSLVNAQWVTSNLPYDGFANKIDFYDVNHGITCGYSPLTYAGKIFYTTNSGINWIQSSYPSELRFVTDIQYINSSIIYISGAENIIPKFSNPVNYTYKRILLKSINSGISWNRVTPYDTMSGKLDNIHFINENTGYGIENVDRAVFPLFHKTTDGGLTWQQISSLDVDFVIRDMEFINENTGFLAGYVCCGVNAMIYKTVNGGETWKNYNYRSTDDFTSINFFDENNGVVIGRCTTSYHNGSKIYLTTNSGETWDSVAAFNDIYPTTIKALKNTGTALASGFNNPLSNTPLEKTYYMKTTDYGSSWLLNEFSTNKLIVGSKLIDANNFFICGGDSSSTAVVMKSTNGGTVFINKSGNEIPNVYSLIQNYPNPFNPTTKIKVNIAGIEKVKLTVYDLLGKEVTKLIDGKYNAGTYEITFDGSKLTSGVYFYQLSVGNKKYDTKKMLLMK